MVIIILVANMVLNLHYLASPVSSVFYAFIATIGRYDFGVSEDVAASFGFYSLGNRTAPIDLFARVLYFGF